MAPQLGFDNKHYLQEQTTSILDRLKTFHSKLYLEFRGKLLFDHHAARVLPGFDPNVNMSLLRQLKDDADGVNLTSDPRFSTRDLFQP